MSGPSSSGFESAARLAKRRGILPDGDTPSPYAVPGVEHPTPLAAAPADASVPAIPVDPEVAFAADVGAMTPRLVQVLKRTICKELTDDELLLFLARCARKKLDPFDQVYVFVDKFTEGPEKGKRVPDTPFSMGTRIDGIRDLSMRSGKFGGIEFEPIAPDPAHPELVIGWRCRVWRMDVPKPFVEEALFSEYAKGRLWKVMPETMCRKVAESKARRAAFPSELAGWYEPAEMSQRGTD